MKPAPGKFGSTFIVVGTLLCVIRILIVLLWSVLGHNVIGANIWVELGLTVLSLFIVGNIAGAMVTYYAQRLGREYRFENIITTTTMYSVSTLALMLFGAIVPGEFVGATPTTWLTVITSHLIAIGTYTISIGLAAFLTVVSLQRQHKRTRLYLSIQTICVLGIWLTTTLVDVGSEYGVLAMFLAVIGSIVTLLNTRRLNWIGTLPLEKKIRLLWLCICGAFAAIVLTFMLTVGTETYVMQSTRVFLSSGTSIPAVPAVLNLFGFLFFVRMVVATIVSLPNSGIVDRRSNEVQALTGLTRSIARSVGVEALLSSVTQYSLSVCRAHGAWCEMYDQGGLRVVGQQLVSEDYVLHLHRNQHIDRILRKATEPVHIDSFTELYSEAPSTVVRSLVAIPICVGNNHVGTVVMFSTIDYGFEQDDVTLLASFGDAIGVGIEQQRLQESALERERLQREFEVARSIQVSLLPRVSPVSAQWEVDAVMLPATQVGGDYYDFVEYGSGHCGAVIADVSGKGVPAALYMATLKGVVLAQSRVASGPADLLRRINATLLNAMDKRTYISMVAVELDGELGQLRIARAGHTPVLVRNKSGVHTLCPRGSAIGLLAQEQFAAILEECTMPVEAGDVCLLSTDGVTERRNPDLVELTNQPLEHLLSVATSSGATEIVQQTLALVEGHGAGTDAHDDITIVAIRVLNNDGTPTYPSLASNAVGGHI